MSTARQLLSNSRELKQLRRLRQRERQKRIGLDWQNNNSAQASGFIVPFFAFTARLRRKCLIYRFLEGVNTEQRLTFSFPEIRWPYRIQLQKKIANI